jgi:hypothetical protein
MKQPYSFKLEPGMIPDLQVLAALDNRPLNNYVENLLTAHIAAYRAKIDNAPKGLIKKKTVKKK